MKPATLLRLYPREWRERYAEEFLDACGDHSLSFQQVIDIVCGAVDARFSPQAHVAAAGRTQGVSMSVNPKALCARPAQPITLVDGVKGAIALVASVLLLVTIGRAAHGAGWHNAGRFCSDIATPMSTLVMCHVMFMKGQSTTAKIVIIGGAAALLVAISAAEVWL